MNRLKASYAGIQACTMCMVNNDEKELMVGIKYCLSTIMLKNKELDLCSLTRELQETHPSLAFTCHDNMAEGFFKVLVYKDEKAHAFKVHCPKDVEWYLWVVESLTH